MYMLIAGNNSEPFNFNVMCRAKDEDFDEITYFIDDQIKYKEMDFCFVIDGYAGTIFKDFKIVDWENRDNAKTIQEAAKVVANQLSELDIRYPSKSSLEEIEDYARSKGVPFSATVHTQFLQNFVNSNPDWDSSSTSC